jgi:putative membrane protein
MSARMTATTTTKTTTTTTRKAALSADLELCEFPSNNNKSSEKMAASYDLELCHPTDESLSISTACLDCYQKTHPLVYALAAGQETRTTALQKDGAAQIYYPKSNEGWCKTLFMWQGRSLDWIALPWLVVVLFAIVYTCIQELAFIKYEDINAADEVESWDIFFGIVLQSTLGFLLVFRLNRAATRWWTSRDLWGNLIARARSFTSGLLVHGGHAAADRDNALRWLGAYAVAVTMFLHDTNELDADMFAGLLSPPEVLLLQDNPHPPLFAAEQVRYFIKKIFSVTTDTPLALGMAWSHQLTYLENQLDTLLDDCGGMEKIKATPLPIVYVSHLRTFLLGSLLLLPFIWGRRWGWSTIPIVAVAAFALLGIEAASAEVEQPFRRSRPNALNMDGFCIGILANMLQMVRQHADRELEQQQQLLPIQKIELAEHREDRSATNTFVSSAA